MVFLFVAYLENIIGTFSAQVVLAGQDDHRLGKHFQAYGTYELFLQVLHGIHFGAKALSEIKEIPAEKSLHKTPNAGKLVK